MSSVIMVTRTCKCFLLVCYQALKNSQKTLTLQQTGKIVNKSDVMETYFTKLQCSVIFSQLKVDLFSSNAATFFGMSV